MDFLILSFPKTAPKATPTPSAIDGDERDVCVPFRPDSLVDSQEDEPTRLLSMWPEVKDESRYESEKTESQHRLEQQSLDGDPCHCCMTVRGEIADEPEKGFGTTEFCASCGHAWSHIQSSHGRLSTSWTELRVRSSIVHPETRANRGVSRLDDYLIARICLFCWSFGCPAY